jgi:hypothetical protein
MLSSSCLPLGRKDQAGIEENVALQQMEGKNAAAQQIVIGTCFRQLPDRCGETGACLKVER